MSIDYNIPQPRPGETHNSDAFWPVLILIIGLIVSTGYQILLQQDQLTSVTQRVAQMDPKLKQAEYERIKLYKLSEDVLKLSATNANAKQIVSDYKIQETAPEQIRGTFPIMQPSQAK